MPCRSDGFEEDPRSYEYGEKLRKQVDRLTVLLCEAVDLLTSRNTASPALRQWIVEHEEVDRKRQAAEAAQAKAAEVKRLAEHIKAEAARAYDEKRDEVIAALTPEQRRILGFGKEEDR